MSQSPTPVAPPAALTCYHCGQPCSPSEHTLGDKHFCCSGCQTVYELLDQHQLCQYYALDDTPGQSPTLAQFAFLDNPKIARELFDFQNDTISKIEFFVPHIHCTSCLYLLENLYRIHSGVVSSQVDFLQKSVHVTFRQAELSVRQLAELMASIGYEPLLSMSDVVKKRPRQAQRQLLTQLGVAGFCAGNIMLFSFPAYLGLNDPQYKQVFGYLNILLSLPVVFYSASAYHQSVWQSLRQGRINIDFPIMLSIWVAFGRGLYEVLSQQGEGYFDSLTGLIFFLLVGKWFQQKTYDALSFERDYQAYFPMAVTVLRHGQEQAESVQSLQRGDKILVRNGELVPADALLYRGVGQVDYSFVTGEATWEEKHPGDWVYAGGRQWGQSIELEVQKNVSQSYLTQLWNHDIFRKKAQSNMQRFSDVVGRYFTVGVLSLAATIGIFWYLNDPSRWLSSLTAVLIIACPCTLSLSYPFALGNGLRWLGKLGLYLKNAEVIESLSQCDVVVFDKTGTLTTSASAWPEWLGSTPLNPDETRWVGAAVRHSAHPVAQKIKQLFLPNQPAFAFSHFEEIAGQGIKARWPGHELRLGSYDFVVEKNQLTEKVQTAAAAHLSIDGQYLGSFGWQNTLRPGIQATIEQLRQSHDLYLLSGDTSLADRPLMESIFGKKENLHWACSPLQKLQFIEQLQAQGHTVLMIGDGLNDAGALKQADVGVAVSDDSLQFTPMSDAIMAANALSQWPQILRYGRFALRLIRFSYVFSLMYNAIGLSFALRGELSPVIAAVLMPLNSITLVAIASLGMRWKARQLWPAGPAEALHS
jgi:P-type Cu+ transporter